MAVLGLVKDLAWQEPVVTGGKPDNVGQTFFCGFCYISATKELAQPSNVISGL